MITEGSFEVLIKHLRENNQISAESGQAILAMVGQSRDSEVVDYLLNNSCDSKILAEGLSKMMDQPLYPHAEPPSKMPEDPVMPALPAVVESGNGWLLTSNKMFYSIDPLDHSKWSADLRRLLAKQGQDRVTLVKLAGVISRADYLQAVGEAHDIAESKGEVSANAGETEASKKLDKLIHQAVRQFASDLHFEPQDTNARLRVRLDSTLVTWQSWSYEEYLAIANIILGRCGGTPGAYIEALDAMFVFPVPPNRQVKIRVSMVPVTVPSFKEVKPKFTLRILGNTLEHLSLDRLGVLDIPSNPQLTNVRLLCERKNGLILVSGPTGSGKTSTLSAIMAELQKMRPSRARYTAEDPVEINLPGVNHIQVNEASNLDFERIVKSLLRSDPDEIMIGEIRGLPVAKQALTASITGHLVFSTIHTNSAIGCISRLIDLGCDAFIVSEALKAALAQRLVRQLCRNCKVEVPWGALIDGSHEPLHEAGNEMQLIRYTKRAQVMLQDLEFYPTSNDQTVCLQGPGCSHCKGTGYTGRFLVSELLTVSPRVADLISSRASPTQIRDQATREGFRELWEHAAFSIFKQKSTSLDQMIEAIGDRDIDLDLAPKKPDEGMATGSAGHSSSSSLLNNGASNMRAA